MPCLLEEELSKLACLSSVAVYQMSMRLLHKTTIEQLDKPIRSFFWAGSADKRKYHFVK
jgi:hypothetical protein